MDRTLTIRQGSSPSYTFTITDAEGSGLNIDSEEYGVGMTISKEGDMVWTVVPLTVGGVNVAGYFKADSSTNVLHFSNIMCRKISTETTTRFIVTLPVTITSRIAVSDGYTYEAFLLGIKGIDGQKAILYNIPIDSGKVIVVASAIPINIDVIEETFSTVAGYKDLPLSVEGIERVSGTSTGIHKWNIVNNELILYLPNESGEYEAVTDLGKETVTIKYRALVKIDPITGEITERKPHSARKVV